MNLDCIVLEEIAVYCMLVCITSQEQLNLEFVLIHGVNLKTSILIPFTKEAVPTVDIADRRIVTDPPDGLLPGV